MKENIVQEKSFQFAIDIVKLAKSLIQDKKEYVLSKQLLRSGTSVGANIREAQNAQSTRDFIHKLSISQKEADESLYWLEILVATDYIDQSVFAKYHSAGTDILRLLKRIIVSSKRR